MANNANEFENDPRSKPHDEDEKMARASLPEPGEEPASTTGASEEVVPARSEEAVGGERVVNSDKRSFERGSAYQSPENPPHYTSPRWSIDPPQPNQQQNQWYEKPFAPPSFRQGLLLLPGHCLRAIAQPATRTFVYLKRYSSWGMVWVLLAISVALSFRLLAASLDVGGQTAPPIQIPWPVQLLIAPLGFFLFAWVQFSVGRSLSTEKRGRFVEHCYTMQLAIIPLSFIETIFSYFPALYSAASFVFGLYTVILNVLAFKAVHSLTGSKATLVYLSPLIPLFILFACALCSLSASR